MTLVTGSTGLIGYNIVQALIQHGRRVRCLVRSIAKGKSMLPDKCELVPGDITDPPSTLRAMQGCSVVYHAAGLPEQWLADPVLFHQVNVVGNQDVIDAALEQIVTCFIYTTTTDVFEGIAGQVFDKSHLNYNQHAPITSGQSKSPANRLRQPSNRLARRFPTPGCSQRARSI